MMRAESAAPAATPAAAPGQGAKRPWRGRTALDFSALPPGAHAPDVLLLDGTYFACSVGRAQGPLPVRLAETVARLVAVVQPRLTVAAFDSGARKAAPAGSADARRAARQLGSSPPPLQRRGDPRPLAAALAPLGIPSCIAPPGAQGDDVLASLAAAAGASLRCLIASGDADVQASLLRAAPGSGAGGVAWLRVAPHPSAQHPAVLEHVTWQRFFERYGFEPRHYPALGALLGRPRDGVPRLRGVGDRAAAALVRQHRGDVEALLAAAAAGQLRSFRPEVAAALTAPGAAEQLRANAEKCAPRLDAAPHLPPQLQALLRDAAAAASASEHTASSDAAQN